MAAKKNKEDNFLLYIPKIKHEEWEERKGKVYLIFHHDKDIEKFIRWLFKKSTVSDMELDKRGSAVWKLIDGKKNIYEIAKIMSEKFGDTPEDSQQRLIMYIRYLLKKGWIAVEKGEQ